MTQINDKTQRQAFTSKVSDTSSTDDSQSDEGVASPLYPCYMNNKVLEKTLFLLQLVGQELRVISRNNKRVKATLQLENLHARTFPKQVRTQPASEERKDQSYWYPLKLVFAEKKSRMVFLESRKQRAEVLSAILTAQGYPSQLEQYEVEYEIEEGSSNPVAIGFHKGTGTRVAIKATDSKKYQRLAQENHVSEAEAMSMCIDNKRVVTFVEEFRQQNNHYLVTNFAPGGDLLKYCMSKDDKKHWMSEKTAKHIFTQLAHGLRDMHKVGLVHRDLKLMNIFMTDSSPMPRVKIGDLGLACKLAQGEVIVKKAGTFAFMAPEVILNQPTDSKSDIWSLGIILYTLIAFKLPFEAKYYTEAKAPEMLEKEIPFEAPTFQSCSPLCIDLLKGMLKRD